MAFVVWTSNNNPRSYSMSAFWNTFKTRGEAEKFAADHPDTTGPEPIIPTVMEDPQVPAGFEGAFGDYPDSCYRCSGQSPRKAEVRPLDSKLVILCDDCAPWVTDAEWNGEVADTK